MKYCKKCECNKNTIEFGNDKNTKDGLNFYCKSCIKKRYKNLKECNPEYIKECAKKYREKNKDLIAKKAHENFKKDKETYLTRNRESYYRNKDTIALKRKEKRDSPSSREKENKRQKEWRERNPEKYRNTVRKWQINNRIKINAHAKVHRAVEKGALLRPDICSQCGLDKGVIEGHHEDYEKPLEVIWLCRLCHGGKIAKL